VSPASPSANSLEPPGARRPPAPPSSACDARVGPDGLRRAALRRTLDAGLGSWLQGVVVDPKVERGQFRGWIVRSLHPGDACFADVDLQPGDVVTRINGHTIERPEEAHDVWAELRTAPALMVDYLRAGQRKTLRFTIVDP
jgi:hypothetical protein